MTDADKLYAEVKPDIEAVSQPLFEFAEQQLRKRGNFLPHGALLTDQLEVRLVQAGPEPGHDRVDSSEILPLLHQALRAEVQGSPVRALGLAENVTVTPANGRSTKAIKVLIEHSRGFTVALYLPFARKLLGGYTFGETFAAQAKAEVGAWT
jgi:hypothetical protein